jgi:hypothetical protein
MKHNYNRHPNQFSQSDPRGLYLLLTTMALGLSLWTYGEVNIIKSTVPFSPMGVSIVKAQEPAVEPIVEARSIKEQAIEYIYQIFGDDASKMVTIIGECENKGWNPKAVNTNRNGSKDYNLAQVNDLNGRRDKQCAGLDYRNNWKDNLDCAKIIKDSQGIKAWSCSYLVGVDPFYVKGK